MIGRISAQVALLAFAAALLAGLCAGNSATVVLERALIAMFVGLVVGMLASWTGKVVLRDHLQRKKLTPEKPHGANSEPPSPEEAGETSQAVETG